MARSDYVFPASARTPLDWERHALAFEKRLLVSFVEALVEGERFASTPQDPVRSTYMPRLHTDIHGWIDMDRPANEIERVVLAFSRPYPGARTLLNNKPARIFDAFPAEGWAAPHPFMRGLVFRLDGDVALVHVADGHLRLRASDIVGPRAIRVGDRLWTPRSILDRAATRRAVYDVDGLVGEVPEIDA